MRGEKRKKKKKEEEEEKCGSLATWQEREGDERFDNEGTKTRAEKEKKRKRKKEKKKMGCHMSTGDWPNKKKRKKKSSNCISTPQIFSILFEITL